MVLRATALLRRLGHRFWGIVSGGGTEIFPFQKQGIYFHSGQAHKAGYSKKFLEAHREEITLHKVAKAAFDELGVKKIPKVKELSIEYAEVLTAKKQTYTEYRQVKNEAQELLIAQRNIASLYDAERKEEEQKRQKENQIH